VIVTQYIPIPSARNAAQDLRLSKNLFRIFDFLSRWDFDDAILKRGSIA
jgi:hypothetical protein